MTKTGRFAKDRQRRACVGSGRNSMDLFKSMVSAAGCEPGLARVG